MEEFWLLMLDRAEHGRQVVIPARKPGTVLLSDRSGFCTMAYQGAAMSEKLGLPLAATLEFIYRQWEAVAPLPDMVVLLDVTPEEAIRRLMARGSLDDYETPEQLKAYRVGYAAALKYHKGHLLTIDTTRKDFENVVDEVVAGILETMDTAGIKGTQPIIP